MSSLPFLFYMVYWTIAKLAQCAPSQDSMGGTNPLEQEALQTAQAAYAMPDPKMMNALQMAYIGDTVHDLFVRSYLVSRGMSVGAMHKQVRMVSAFAQARMLEAIEPDLSPEEADVARRGRNVHAKHAAPKNADPADYAHATGLEALWGYLYVTGNMARLDTLIRAAMERTEELWRKRSSR